MTSLARRAVASLAVLASGLVAAGLTVGLVPAALVPAAGAATCTSAGGVSVVVDYRELGGGTVTACALDGGGKSAAAVFASVGVTISYATRQPGFVCRVNGVPASDPCVNASPADAYWGLWWADGSQASWTYSSSGVGGLTVPSGGAVGWSWQQDRAAGAGVPPGVAPPVTTAPSTSSSPSPTSSPTAPSSPSPTASPSPPSGGGSTPSPSHPSPGPSAGADGAGSPSAEPSPAASPPAPSESPRARESPRDPREVTTPGDASEDPALAPESPGGPGDRADPDASASGSEPLSDSGASAPQAGAPALTDQPARVPAAVTWGIVALLALAIAGSAVVARRRRGV